MPKIALNFLLGKAEGRVLREGKNGDSDLEREGDRKGGCCPHSQWLVALTRGPGSRGRGGPPSRALATRTAVSCGFSPALRPITLGTSKPGRKETPPSSYTLTHAWDNAASP